MTRYEVNKLELLRRIATSLEGIEKCLKDEDRFIFVKEETEEKPAMVELGMPEKQSDPVSAAEYLKGLHLNLSDLKGV